jgi:hypothetical protein
MELAEKDLKVFEYLLWRAQDYENATTFQWIGKTITFKEADMLIANCRMKIKEEADRMVKIDTNSGPPQGCETCEG